MGFYHNLHFPFQCNKSICHGLPNRLELSNSRHVKLCWLAASMVLLLAIKMGCRARRRGRKKEEEREGEREKEGEVERASGGQPRLLHTLE